MANPIPDFPTSIHSTSDVSGFGSSKLGSTTPTHTALEGKQEEELVATQTKLGIGVSVPALGKALLGTGAGTSAWGDLEMSLLADVTDAPADGEILVFRTASSGYVHEAKPSSSGSVAWGDITGTLASQTDLATALTDNEVELQTTATHIQWRRVGGSWANLVALSELEGPQGPAGTNGTNGTNGADGADGADGREVELQKSSTHVQWRYIGEAEWSNLVALEDITGPAGAAGAAGADGADGADGQGVPVGGDAGEILAKVSADDFDTEWIPAPTGGGGGGDPIAVEVTVATWAELVTAVGDGKRRIGITADLTATSILTVYNDMVFIGLGGQRLITLGNNYFQSDGAVRVFRQLWKNLSIICTAGQVWFYQGGGVDILVEDCTLNGGATSSRLIWFAGNTSVGQEWTTVFNRVNLTAGNARRSILVDVWGSAFVKVAVLDSEVNLSGSSSTGSLVTHAGNGSFSATQLYVRGSRFTNWSINRGAIYSGANTDIRNALARFDNCHITVTGTSFVDSINEGNQTSFNNTTIDLGASGFLVNPEANKTGVITVNGGVIRNGAAIYRNYPTGCAFVVNLNDVSIDKDNLLLCNTSGTFVSNPKYNFRNARHYSYNTGVSHQLVDTDSFISTNTSGGSLSYGSAVVRGTTIVSNNYTHTTTTTTGDPMFLGITQETNGDNGRGFVHTRGFVRFARVDGTDDIAIGDSLGTHTVAGVLAKNTTAGQRVAMALAAYTTDDANGLIPVLLYGRAV